MCVCVCACDSVCVCVCVCVTVCVCMCVPEPTGTCMASSEGAICRKEALDSLLEGWAEGSEDCGTEMVSNMLERPAGEGRGGEGGRGKQEFNTLSCAQLQLVLQWF